MTAADTPHDSDIAVIAYAAHFPGAPDAAAYWQAIRDGREAIHPLSEAALREAGVEEATFRRPDYVAAAATLDGLADWDAAFFGMSPKEAAIMDPQHRRFLSCCWQAFEHGAIDPQRFQGAIGVFAGCGMNSYFMFNLLRNPQLVEDVGLFLLRHTGNDKDFLATRASYLFDLHGPSVNIQTACSTSLVATHLACQSLLSGECDLAVAGGSTIELPHGRGYIYREREILSADGHCRPFDHRASGTLFGSGAGVVLLRRLEDALRDGDPIRAVIKASAVNNDGAAKVGYLAPSVEGQAAAVAEALALCEFPVDTIGYLEAHGTATPIGDPIEVAALNQAFRQYTDAVGFCGLGSVKGNIGHLDTAAGVAGLIKAIGALEHGYLPPSLHFEAPSPDLPLADSPFTVVAEGHPWPQGDHPRRAAVNSLGVGGTNAFLVLEEAPPRLSQAAAAPTEAQLLCLSAKDGKALRQRMMDLAAHLDAHPEQPLAAVASTLWHGRQAFTERAALLAATAQEASALLREAATSPSRRVPCDSAAERPPQPIFLFPGGGASVFGIAAGLEAEHEVVAQVLAEGDQLLRSWQEPSPLALLRGEGEPAEALDPRRQLPALFLLECALARQWMAEGVEPQAMLGLSLGELTAAHLAGVFSFEEGLRLVIARAALFAELPAGHMISVPMARTDLEGCLPSELDLAIETAPDLQVVSGAAEAVDAFAAELAQRGIEVTPIPLATAAHTRLLEPVLARYRQALSAVQLQPPATPLLSNFSGEWLTAAQAVSVDYWVDQLRHRVRLEQNLDQLMADYPQAQWIEVGPGATLGSLLRSHSQASQAQTAIPSLAPVGEAQAEAGLALRTAMARLWTSGGTLPPSLLPPPPSADHPRLSLPGYPFQEQRYWIEATEGQVAETGATVPDVPRHERLEAFFSLPTWEEAPLSPSSAAVAATRWLVFEDELGLGRALADSLREEGHEVLSVRHAALNGRQSDQLWWLDSDRGGEGYAALVEDLVTRDALPTRIVNLWALTGSEIFRTNLNRFAHNLERAFFSHFYLLQELARRDLLGGMHLLSISNGARQVAGESLPDPIKATLDGLRLVVPHEHAGFHASSLDVDFFEGAKGRSRAAMPSCSFEEALAALHAEAQAAPPQGCFALRQGRRLRRQLDRRSSDFNGSGSSSSATPMTVDGGRYLITGGLGGIGLSLAEALAESAQARGHHIHLLLVSRRGLVADSAQAAAVAHLRELGAEVHVGAVDITDHEELSAFLEQSAHGQGPVRGIIHAAGTIADALLATKTAEQVQEVFAAKVYGTQVLDLLFRDQALDFFHLCSSTSAWIGPAGQSDYVAANAWLSAFAAARRERLGEDTLAISWGVWSEVGMAAQAAARRPQERIDRLDSEDWVVAEHQLEGLGKVLPGTAMIEALVQADGGFRAQVLEEILYLRPLVVADGKSPHVRVRCHALEADGRRRLELQSHAIVQGHAGWLSHASATLSPELPRPGKPLDLPVLAARCPRAAVAAAGEPGLTTALEESGRFRFGPRWRALRGLRLGEDEALAELILPDAFHADLAQHPLHPALLDLASGCGWELIPGFRTQEASWLPTGVERLECFAPLEPHLHTHLRLLDASEEAARFDATITDGAGKLLLRLHGLRVVRIGELQLPALTAADLEADRPLQASPAEQALDRNIARGLTVAEAKEAWRRLRQHRPGAEAVVSSLEMEALEQQAEALLKLQRDEAASGDRFARPELETPFVAPTDEIEQALQEMWQDLLGIERLGIDDDFFALGGHSLIAVRLFSRLRSRWHQSYAISLLFEAPTVRALAARLRADLAEAEEVAHIESPQVAPAAVGGAFNPLVPIHPQGHRPPLFVAAGKGGNAMNLRHLAARLEAEQPFYGIQHRGFDGQEPPHESLEAMAAEAIDAIRAIQPHGPYFLGGFSAGGLLVYEMAQQLTAAGEAIGLLTFFDTPAPDRFELGPLGRLQLHFQELMRRGPSYLVDRARRRRELMAQARGREPEAAARAEGEGEGPHPEALAQTHLQVAEAWNRMEAAYTARPYPGSMVLFRPYMVGNEEWSRFLNRDAENGWGGLIGGGIEVYELPGGHATMCEEPHVRIFAKHLTRVLARSQAPRVGSATE